MENSTIVKIICLVCIIIITTISYFIKKSNNKVIKELTTKLETATPEILDIIDRLLNEVESVKDYETIEDFRNHIVDSAVDEALEYIKEHADKYEISEYMLGLLTSKRFQSIIENIISTYKYDSNFNMIFDNLKRLESPDDFIDEDECLKNDNNETEQENEILEGINNFYDDKSDV